MCHTDEQYRQDAREALEAIVRERTALRAAAWVSRTMTRDIEIPLWILDVVVGTERALA